jgi:2,3-bisphosphoglycerate-dependent phosphoglycerate mutase
MKCIFLVRHCKAEGQEPEASLTHEGFEQANLLAQFFADKEIDRIVSSPYKRAIQSIEPFANSRGLNIEKDERLEERVLSRQPMDIWMECLEKTFLDMDLKYYGGESSKEALARGRATINDILKGNNNHVIVVTHGNLMTLILKSFDNQYGFEEWKRLSNPDVYQVTVYGQDNVKVHRVWNMWENH